MRTPLAAQPVRGGEHEETDDEAPPQWEDQPAREDGHPH